MFNERIVLNMKEQKINDIMVRLIYKQIKVSDVVRLTGLSERQIYRKKKAYLLNGISSIPHKSRNRPTGKGYSNKFKDMILNLYIQEYLGWNFHHFNDSLHDYHNINVSDYFIYKLLTNSGIQSPYKYKQRKKSHPPRERKENSGDLIQVDASKHPWFSFNDKYYYLHGGIDDATNIVTGAFFAEQETIYGYQMVMYQTCKNYGIPVCLYTDFRTVFQSNKHELTLDEQLAGKQINNTRFTNMLDYLGVDIKSTSNPRSKGRIERLWRTFQDRLYKELKKFNIDSIEKANDYLVNVFLPIYNKRFAFPIDNTKDSFVSLDDSFDFNRELAVWKEHSIYHNCYLRFNKQYHIILDSNALPAYINTKDKVKVFTFLDGTTHVLFNEQFYDIKTIKTLSKEAFITKLTSTNERRTPIEAIKASPWRNGLPSMPSRNQLQWAYFNPL